MAKIIDPDSLSVYVHATSAAGATTEEVVILTGPKTVQLRVAGNLDDTAPGKTSGAAARAVYSFLKEEYLNGTDSATLRRFRFPLKMIFEGSFLWVNGWAPADQQTRDLFRDAGFYEQVSGNSNACMVSLNQTYEATDLAYYKQATGFDVVVSDFDKAGQLNENIDITGATTYLKMFLREQGKLYSEYDLLKEYDIASITYQAYFFPLPNDNDAKVVANDTTISTTAPYTGMKVNYLKGTGFTTYASGQVYEAGRVVQDSTGRWFFTPAGGTSAGGGTTTASDTGILDWESYDGEEQIGANWYAFNRVVTCNNGLDNEVHEFNMWSLRQSTDINANDTASVNQRGFGTVRGDNALMLDTYIGDTIYAEPGVLLRGFNANSTNSIMNQPITVDGGGVDSEGFPLAWSQVSYPFVAAGNFNFSDNIVNELDAETYYTAYFTYITTVTDTTLAVGTPTGDQAPITWTGTVLDHLQAGDYIRSSGWTEAGNNGLWYVDSVGANTLTATKQDGVAPIAEIAGDSVTILENPYESPGAIIVQNNSAADISGQVTGASIAWDFDYTNNNQGGRTPNSDAPITIIAGALDGAEWVEATHTITAAVGQNVAVNPNDELNYINPA